MPAVLLLMTAAAVTTDDVSDAAGHLLAAEVALSEQDYRTAAEEYRKAAELSDQVDVARREGWIHVPCEPLAELPAPGG